MKINLWYCQELGMWRWTLTDDRRPISKMVSGQDTDLQKAMRDVALTVENMIREGGELTVK